MNAARLAIVALFAAVPLTQLAAQPKPQTREGFTIAFGLGSGSVGFSCDFCNSERRSDPTGFLRIGGTLRPNLIIAGESRAWTHSEEGETVTIGFLLAEALYYPMSEKGWYLLGGLGVGAMRNEDDASGDELTSTGGALSFGTGYDFRLGKNFSLTPFVSFAAIGGGEPKQNGVSIPASGKLNFDLWQFGLAFTWH